MATDSPNDDNKYHLQITLFNPHHYPLRKHKFKITQPTSGTSETKIQMFNPGIKLLPVCKCTWCSVTGEAVSPSSSSAFSVVHI